MRGKAECVCPPPPPTKPPTKAFVAPLNSCKPTPCDRGCICLDIDGMAECVCPPPPAKPMKPKRAPKGLKNTLKERFDFAGLDFAGRGGRG